MNALRKLWSFFSMLLGISIYASDLDDLESRIDQMLDRLQNVESRGIPKSPSTPSPPSTSISRDKLPTITLPSVSGEKNSSTSNELAQNLGQLEVRIENLLKKLDLHADLPPRSFQAKTQSPPPPSSLIKVSDSAQSDPANSFALPDDISNEDMEAPTLPRNRFNLHLGFSIPNESTYSDTGGNHGIAFRDGFEVGFEYNRLFQDESYIGAFLEGKFFETESLAGSATDGDNQLLNFGLILGQDWSLSEHFAIKTQAGIGATSTHYEVTSEHYSASDLVFHYSFLLGLGIKWNEYWQTCLFYELDGRSSADRLDYQSFHQIGIKAGVGF